MLHQQVYSSRCKERINLEPYVAHDWYKGERTMRAKSTRHLELPYQRPTGINVSNVKDLDAFLTWTVEASSYWPMNDGAKLAVDKLLAHLQNRMPVTELDTKAIDGFIQWVEEAGKGCPIGENARAVIDLFVAYRDRLTKYQAQLRNYWLQ